MITNYKWLKEWIEIKCGLGVFGYSYETDRIFLIDDVRLPITYAKGFFWDEDAIFPVGTFISLSKDPFLYILRELCKREGYRVLLPEFYSALRYLANESQNDVSTDFKLGRLSTLHIPEEDW